MFLLLFLKELLNSVIKFEEGTVHFILIFNRKHHWLSGFTALAKILKQDFVILTHK